MNQAGIDLVKEFESFKDKAYICSGGRLTCGWGHTKGVKAGDTCTKEQAEAWLMEDIEEAEKIVDQYVDVHLNGNQHAALTSFVFNVGHGKEGVKDGFAELKKGGHSTLLKLLNRGWYDEAAAQFARWNKAGGEVLGGLARRRKAEYELWNTPLKS